MASVEIVGNGVGGRVLTPVAGGEALVARLRDRGGSRTAWTTISSSSAPGSASGSRTWTAGGTPTPSCAARSSAAPAAGGAAGTPTRRRPCRQERPLTSAVETSVRPYLLGGAPVATGDRQIVTFPYDGRIVAEVTLADEDAIERALAIASAAREATASIPPHERASVLNRAAALAEERLEELARQMTLETGNAVWETRVEVRRTAEILRNAAEEARRVTGEVIPIDAWPNGTGRHALTRRFPVGPVLAITPYNAPLLLVAHKLASAYASGNPVHRAAGEQDAPLRAVPRRAHARGRRSPGGRHRPAVRVCPRRADGT